MIILELNEDTIKAKNNFLLPDKSHWRFHKNEWDAI